MIVKWLRGYTGKIIGGNGIRLERVDHKDEDDKIHFTLREGGVETVLSLDESEHILNFLLKLLPESEAAGLIRRERKLSGMALQLSTMDGAYSATLQSIGNKLIESARLSEAWSAVMVDLMQKRS